MLCDEEGFDIIPMQMVSVLAVQDGDPLTSKLSTKPLLEAKMRHVKIENEISTFERSSRQEMQGGNYYDASDEVD